MCPFELLSTFFLLNGLLFTHWCISLLLLHDIQLKSYFFSTLCGNITQSLFYKGQQSIIESKLSNIELGLGGSKSLCWGEQDTTILVLLFWEWEREREGEREMEMLSSSYRRLLKRKKSPRHLAQNIVWIWHWTLALCCTSPILCCTRSHTTSYWKQYQT